MKKYFSFSVAVATMFSVASCSQEEVVGNVSGNDVEVTFNATMEGQAVSRAIGDGLTVDQLYFAVYDEAGTEIEALRQDDAHGNAVPVSGYGATVKVRLVKGQTYQFVFWAQKSGAGHYDTSNMQAISVDYNNISNDESRDAFYAYVGATKVTGPFSQNVTLKRPFAQLNLGTTAEDWSWAKTAGVQISHSNVTVEGAVYSTLKTFSGDVEGETTVEFTLNEIPSQDDKLVTDNKEYYYLSTNYLLAPADKELSKEIVFTLNAGANPINELKVYNAPLQRNWRTNIVGEILTGEGTFNITIDPIFEGDRNYDMPGSVLYVVEDDVDLKNVLKYAENGSTIKLTKDLDITESTEPWYNFEKELTLEGQGYDLEVGNDANYGIFCREGSDVTFNDVNIVSGGGAIAVINANATFNSGSVSVASANTSPRYNFYVIQGSTLTINGGEFSFNKNLKRAYIHVAAGSTVYINGGTFGAPSTRNDYKAGIMGEGTVIITGGTFGFNPSKWVAEGYEAVKNGSTWTVSAK